METSGFDYDPEFGGEDGSNDTATYTLTVDEDHNLLTVALVWHVKIDGGTGNSFDGTATLYDLDLEIYDIAADEVVAESVGSMDNRENLWIRPGSRSKLRNPGQAGGRPGGVFVGLRPGLDHPGRCRSGSHSR